ncbi:MAG: DMT family transporter [Alphaproteobacteria bacterium]
MTPPTLTSHRPLLGIALMLLSGTIMPVMNGFGKMLATSYPPEQVIWARLLTHLLWVLAFFLPRSGTALFRTARPSIQLALSLCMLVSTTRFFFAVPHVGLAKASVINFVAPFMVMLLAVPMLGERLALRRCLAVAAGFAGVVVVIRPGFDALDWASIAILASSFFFALFQCYSRLAAAVDRPETSILYSVLAGAVVMSLVVPFGFVVPRTWLDGAIMASLGLVGATGHYFMARAFAYADASIISPFLYWQLLGAVAVGFWLFGDLPDSWTWIGAAMIVGAGIFLAWSEAAGRRAPRG